MAVITTIEPFETTTENPYVSQLDRMYQVIQAILMLVILSGNGLVVVTVLKTKALQTPPNIYVVFVALSDIVTGCGLMFSILYFSYRNSWQKNIYICLGRFIINYFPIFNSILLFLGELRN